jgi:hypothetical protein
VPTRAQTGDPIFVVTRRVELQQLGDFRQRLNTTLMVDGIEVRLEAPDGESLSIFTLE